MGKAHATTVKQQFEGFIPAVFLYARGRLKLGFDAFRRPVLHSSHYVCLKLVAWALSTNNREVSADFLLIIFSSFTHHLCGQSPRYAALSFLNWLSAIKA